MRECAGQSSPPSPFPAPPRVRRARARRGGGRWPRPRRGGGSGLGRRREPVHTGTLGVLSGNLRLGLRREPALLVACQLRRLELARLLEYTSGYLGQSRAISRAISQRSGRYGRAAGREIASATSLRPISGARGRVRVMDCASREGRQDGPGGGGRPSPAPPLSTHLFFERHPRRLRLLGLRGEGRGGGHAERCGHTRCGQYSMHPTDCCNSVATCCCHVHAQDTWSRR